MNLYRAEVLMSKEIRVSWVCLVVLGTSIVDKQSINKEKKTKS